ncbi:MAG: hypothetical protein C4555_04410 [Dehalococcoidia bacterium]|nr:MAG: hypothetical protein C4555_04410 [Dehalococcoidia bacterium]
MSYDLTAVAYDWGYPAAETVCPEEMREINRTAWTALRAAMDAAERAAGEFAKAKKKRDWARKLERIRAHAAAMADARERLYTAADAIEEIVNRANPYVETATRPYVQRARRLVREVAEAEK